MWVGSWCGQFSQILAKGYGGATEIVIEKVEKALRDSETVIQLD